MHTFQTEFPDFDPATLPAIPSHWVDSSWRNDACPSFEAGEGLRVWVDYADPANREFPESPRFGLQACEKNEGAALADIVASDLWEDILRHAIAFRFRGVLREWLTPQELAEADTRNRAETDPGICHSHDHCDANMAMADAFEAVMGRGLFPEDGSGMSEADCILWNAAWDIAKAAGLCHRASSEMPCALPRGVRTGGGLTMTYAIAKAAKAALEAAEREASANLRKVPGIGSGPMGLTPDAVKARPDYQAAKAAHDRAFGQLRRFNAGFCRTYKAEMRAERRASGR